MVSYKTGMPQQKAFPLRSGTTVKGGVQDFAEEFKMCGLLCALNS
jgi:hypothetical protein